MAEIYTFIFDYKLFRKTRKLNKRLEQELGVKFCSTNNSVGISQDYSYSLRLFKDQINIYMKDGYSKNDLQNIEDQLKRIAIELNYYNFSKGLCRKNDSIYSYN